MERIEVPQGRNAVTSALRMGSLDRSHPEAGARIEKKAKSAHQMLLNKAPPKTRPPTAPSLTDDGTHAEPSTQIAMPESDSVTAPKITSMSHIRPLNRKARDSGEANRDNISAKSTLRSYRSFTNPFKKKSRRSSHTGSGLIQYDSSLPPFNFAYEENVSVTPSARAISSSGSPSRTSQRKLSASLKDRLKRVFSRGKAEDPEFPIQHVSAKQFHFNVATPNDDDEDTPPEFDHDSLIARRSQDTGGRAAQNADKGDEARSRVTSWNSSTVADTTCSALSSKRLSSIRELPSQRTGLSDDVKETSNAEILSDQYRRRRPATSHESQQLYHALCHQISSAEPFAQGVHNDHGHMLSHGLPVLTHTQHTIGDSDSNQGNLAKKSSKLTIRAVTPELSSTGEREMASTEDLADNNFNEILVSTDQADLQNREQQTAWHTEHLRKAERRWQGTLKDEVLQSQPSKAEVEANPFRLGSIPTSPPQAQIPATRHHEPIHNDTLGTSVRPAFNSIPSPSIYHFPNDEISRPNTPEAAATSVATVIGREVKTYNLDAGGKATCATSTRPSHEWRSWMSDQLSEMDVKLNRNTLMLDLPMTNGYAEPLQVGQRLDSPAASAHHSSSSKLRRLSSSLGETLAAAALQIRKTRPDGPGSHYEGSSNEPTECQGSGNTLKMLASKVSGRGLRTVRQTSSSTRLASSSGLTAVKDIAHSGPTASDTPPLHEMSWAGISLPFQSSRIPSSRCNLTPSLFPPARPAPPIPPTINSSPTTNHPSPPPIPLVGPAETTTPARPPTSLTVRLKSSTSSLSASTINIRRKKLSASSATQFEDMTLQRITEGPYANTTCTPHVSPQQYKSGSVEGSRPCTPVTRKRIAVGREGKGSGKENDVPDTPTGKMPAVRLVQEQRSGGGKSASPGQRMAEEFLSRCGEGGSPGGRGVKKNKGSLGVMGGSPLFV
ncbi:hypothetical protein K461DRAFT_291625 [Myriangium duriaei CBS 260.36]|uniref:Uncharacterized protein n=1 Tax=Myriangium duriaei CBS 260.36 TaxID=1168546 RepID=A0A9P4J7Q4_9PEZI|nr:hypothetical protein K461DRAFT_291625 [Myriangium duriaei CBS 260.36]